MSLARMVVKLEAQPDVGLPKVFTEAEPEGAYRFLSNEAVQAADILKPHIDATAARAREIDTVLAVHDGTVVTFGGESRRTGLAPTRGCKSQQGFLAHATLALAAGEHTASVRDAAAEHRGMAQTQGQG